MKKRTIVATVVTVAWAGFVTYLIASDWETFKELKFNEKGDFLSGFVAPAVFFWLIIGYFQQGEELQQNTEALNLQATELQNSVAEQKALVREQQAMAEATKRHVELLERDQAERRAQEIRENQVSIRYVGNGGASEMTEAYQTSIKLANQGRAVSTVTVSCSDPDIFKGPKHLPFFDNGDGVLFRFVVPKGTNSSVELKFAYIDGLGRQEVTQLSLRILNADIQPIYPMENQIDKY